MSRVPSREEALFADALAQSESERSAFLAKAGGPDVALLGRMAALIAAYEGRMPGDARTCREIRPFDEHSPSPTKPMKTRLPFLSAGALAMCAFSFAATSGSESIVQAAPQFDVGLLETLCNAFGPSGFEEEVQAIVHAHGRKFADEVTSDKTGSLILRKVGDARGPRIMLAGHADEVGFVISNIDSNGMLRFHELGGWWDQVLLGQEVVIRPFREGKKVIGIIGAKPPHILSPEERAKLVTKDAMYIDIGCKSKQEVLDLGIRIGDPAVPHAVFRTLERTRVKDDGEARGGKAVLAVAKAFDDRIGVFIGLEVLRRLSEQKIAHPNTVYFVSTAQEEVGLRGASTAARMVKPDIGFALDVDISFDVPGATEMNQKMGHGACISAGDGSMIPNHQLRRFVVEKAEQGGVRHQAAFLRRGGTDAGAMHLTEAGVPSLFIGVATRHIHSHHGMLDLDDVEDVINLLVQMIPKLDRETVAGFTRVIAQDDRRSSQ